MKYDFYSLMCFIIYLIVFLLHVVVLMPNMTFFGQLNGNRIVYVEFTYKK